jgi:hypothetical protein
MPGFPGQIRGIIQDKYHPRQQPAMAKMKKYHDVKLLFFYK